MRHSHTIAIGAGNEPWSVDPMPTMVLTLPGEEPGRFPDHVEVIRPPTLADALHRLRLIYCGTAAVASLGSLRLIDNHPVSAEIAEERARWSMVIRSRLSGFIHDLGNSTMDCWEGARNIIANGAELSSWPTMHAISGTLKENPAICLGSGPSASRYLDEITSLSRSHRVFACDSIAAAAINRGVRLDAITMIERPRIMADLLPDFTGIKNPLLICSPVVHPDAVKKADRIIWWLNNDEYSEWIAPGVKTEFAGRSAGTLGVAAALLAGCNPIFLVGHDLAYGHDGLSHAADAHPLGSRSHQAMRSQGSFGYHAREMVAIGDHGAHLRTTGLWEIFRSDLEALLALHPGVDVIRVGMDGAHIAGTRVGDLRTCIDGDVSAMPIMGDLLNDPRERIPAIIRDIEALEASCRSLGSRIDAAHTAEQRRQLAADMTIGRIVSAENAWLFRGLFRPLVGGLMVRLHLRSAAGADAWESQRQVLAIQAANVMAMCERMRADLKEII